MTDIGTPWVLSADTGQGDFIRTQLPQWLPFSMRNGPGQMAVAASGVPGLFSCPFDSRRLPTVHTVDT